ncbi:MAG: hypothetical protein ACTS3F_04775 [Phycisphaerales bacterium]
MGSPPLYPNYPDDGPNGSHPSPPDPARPNNTDKPKDPGSTLGVSSNDTTAPHPELNPNPKSNTDTNHDSLPPGERTRAAHQAARASGVDDLLSVIGNLGDQLEAFKQMRQDHEAEALRLADLEQAIAQRETDVAAEEARQAEQRAKLSTAHAAIKTETQRLAEREQTLTQREQAIAQRESEAEALCEQTRGLAEQTAAERAEAQNRLRAVEERESLARALHAAAQEQINASAEAAADRLSAKRWRELAEAERAEANATREQTQKLNEEADAIRAELESTRSDLSAKLEASRHSEEASMAEWERLSEETASLRKKLAAAEKETESLRAGSLTADAVERMVDAEVARARTTWEREHPAPTTSETAPPADEHHLNALRKALDEANARAEKAEASLRKAMDVSTPATGSPSAHGAPPADWERQLRKRDQAIRALKEHLEAAESKALERDQLFKLREQVNAEREQAKAMARVAQRKSARSSAGVTTLCLAIALIASAACAWWLAGHFSPATYLAEATIAPDEREGALNPSHAESWTLYHKKLINDPVFIEKASERLAARGFQDMGSPALLRDAIRTRIDIDDAEGAGLTLALRGVGASSTERALDIFVNTLINHANAARDLRLDRTSTIIAAAADAGDRPVDDPRAKLFGIILGALGAIVLIAFTLLSRWLARAPIATGEALLDLNDSTMGYTEQAAAMHATDPDTTRSHATEHERHDASRDN